MFSIEQCLTFILVDELRLQEIDALLRTGQAAHVHVVPCLHHSKLHEREGDREREIDLYQRIERVRDPYIFS